ncbi:hypothetical protein DL95DRAFT_394996 [Leptodontidium sp. 2 PMI_412]|nr:hypothetical protein DL95DRAFT_394996 [Leptodontidium sp. 2 PMI_412]
MLSLESYPEPIFLRTTSVRYLTPFLWNATYHEQYTYMSGLEGLGAAASVLGVFGAVKTCIDLLDILSSARSAERDLEDLFVHLQWQRIRFYCWVQETGFTEVMVKQEGTPTLQPSEMINLLPREFRFHFMLSHIHRSIDNMNGRLKSARLVLERYSSTSNSTREGWLEKLRRGLNQDADSNASKVPTRRTGSPRLSLFARLRWVAGDEKELSQLLDALRNYNVELKELLPYYKMTAFERRVGLVLVTSKNLAADMAASEFESQSVSAVEGDDQFRQHRGAAQLLKRGYDLEARESAQNLHPPFQSQDEGLSPRRTCYDTAPSPYSFQAQPSLYRNISEFKFTQPGSADSATREFASNGTAPLIIEWRYYSTKITKEGLSALDIRIHMLAMQLQQSSTLPDISVLNCLGHFRDERNYRYGMVFEYPKDCSKTTPISLRDRLMEDHRRRIRRDLGDRFRVARILVTTIYRLFSVRWFHKNISSNNVLFFENNTNPNTLDTPYVCGFEFARRDAQLESSERFPSLYHEAYTATEQRLYWYPDRIMAIAKESQGKGFELPSTSSPRYQREYDAYSLGVLLLEIGLWCPISRIFKDSKTDDLLVFVAEIKKRYMLELRGRMGKVYAEVVNRCLNGSFGCANAGDKTEQSDLVADEDDERRSRAFLEDYERLAVSMMERPLGS